VYVGIDLGGTQLRVALADGRGRLRTVLRRPTDAERGREHVVDALVNSVSDVLAEEGVKAALVRALGIGMPGPLDPVRGLVISPGNLPGFINVPLNSILTRRTGIRSFIHHDAHLAALAEHRHGAGRGSTNLIYVTVSTGIGAGLIVDGKLYSGAGGIAGEVGHIVVQPGGPLCSCGNHGCVEALASGTAIAREARVLGERESGSLLYGIELPNAADVVRAARRADPLAVRILDAAGISLGIAMGTLVNLFNPDLIVLGGSVINAGRLLLSPMRRSMEASSWKAARRGLRIVRPALGPDVGLIGAVEYARLRAKHAGPR
jgi:glucokinase